MKVRNPDLSDSQLGQQHAEAGLPPLESPVTSPGTDWRELRGAILFTALTLVVISLSLLGTLVWTQSLSGAGLAIEAMLSSPVFWTAAAVGFAAQVIDGALGMAYGISATSFLLASGHSPALASASVHIAEVFTTGLSGMAHARLGNVNKALFLRLLLPGTIGAVLGAVVITQLDGAMLKPFVSGYLVLMGLYLLWKASRRFRRRDSHPGHVGKLAFFGGFVDAAGGGGWGPVVNTTLLGAGGDPRTTIGSVNFAEFFLTLGSATAFALLVQESTWPTVGGLVLGGLLAAPAAAWVVRRLRPRFLLASVGVLITSLSLFNLYKALAAA